jgi:hypothetical protein
MAGCGDSGCPVLCCAALCCFDICALQRKILAGEARLVRMVAHPNIVRCLQVLETRRQQVRTAAQLRSACDAALGASQQQQQHLCPCQQCWQFSATAVSCMATCRLAAVYNVGSSRTCEQSCAGAL